MKRWTFAMLAVCLGLSMLATPALAEPGTVTVSISGFKGKEGIALVTLYDSEATWLKVPKALQMVRAKITGETMTVEFKDVKPGTYAVSVVHDENKNNELDMRWLPWPKPKEGSGVSNNAEAKQGPPKWSAAKFVCEASGSHLNITVKYFK